MDQEERAQQQALRHAHEMATMKDQLSEAEAAKNSLQNEVLDSIWQLCVLAPVSPLWITLH